MVLYELSVWLHILAATAWLGGMFFLVLVVVPWLRAGNRAAGGRFLRETGARFRSVGWACFAVLVVTGTFNLSVRGVHLADLGSWAWLTSPFGHVVALKLSVFAVVVVLSAVHDFNIGPRASEALERAPDAPESEALRRMTSWLGRVNALLALILVALAVMVVRGAPW